MFQYDNLAFHAPSMRSIAFCHCLPFPYAMSMELMLITLGWSIELTTIDSKIAKAKSQELVLPQELIRALNVIRSGTTLKLGMVSYIANACWVCFPLSQELMMLLNVMTSTGTCAWHINSNKAMACRQWPPFSHELIPALKLMVSPDFSFHAERQEQPKHPQTSFSPPFYKPTNQPHSPTAENLDFGAFSPWICASDIEVKRLIASLQKLARAQVDMPRVHFRASSDLFSLCKTWSTRKMRCARFKEAKVFKICVTVIEFQSLRPDNVAFTASLEGFLGNSRSLTKGSFRVAPPSLRPKWRCRKQRPLKPLLCMSCALILVHSSPKTVPSNFRSCAMPPSLQKYMPVSWQLYKLYH